jgi:glycosyltransferase involved in cell wall biosynthesis
MRRVPFRRLVTGPPPAAERVLFAGVWFRGHNNPRYAELLPRLERLDRHLLVLHDHRLLRGPEFRLWRSTRGLTDPVFWRLAGRRYRNLFTADNAQIAYFPGPVVSDTDDPVFTPREVELLSRPNVACYVVTAERAARRFESLGVERPWQVVPQGVSLGGLTPEAVHGVRERLSRDGEVVVGYMAAWLLTAGDRGGASPLYNVDHLLDLWEEIHARAPQARLWLLGGASDAVRARVAGRDDVLVLGRVPREQVLPHAAAFDVALYPRTADQGIQAAKVAEYLGAGAPVVSYDYEVVEELRETGAGVLVRSPREFVEAVARLVEDEAERARLAAAARAAGRERDWDALAARYNELLDRYLPPR